MATPAEESVETQPNTENAEECSSDATTKESVESSVVSKFQNDTAPLSPGHQPNSKSLYFAC